MQKRILQIFQNYLVFCSSLKYRLKGVVPVIFICLIPFCPTQVLSDPLSKPYDKQLVRLSELLGALHYLRELCSANEGQRWRQYMQSILDTETSNAVRKARLTQSFNQGYRNIRRTFSNCTPSAQATIDRFLGESIEISEALAFRSP